VLNEIGIVFQLAVLVRESTHCVDPAADCIPDRVATASAVDLAHSSEEVADEADGGLMRRLHRRYGGRISMRPLQAATRGKCSLRADRSASGSADSGGACRSRFVDVVLAMALDAFFANAVPSFRQRPGLWPDRVFFLSVYDYKIDSIVFIICHGQLLALIASTDHVRAPAVV
jgi:hypothetical protein